VDDLPEFKEVMLKTVSLSNRPAQQLIVEKLIAMWEELRAQGVEAYDFAHATLMAADCVMTYHDSLGENERFGRYLINAGQRKVRAVSTFWPPVEPSDWPEGWPKDKFS
jgi:hypothetical protein